MAYIPAPDYQPTYKPMPPYNQPIPGGLSVGMSVYIQGVVNERVKRFSVNFSTGQTPEADIAFHFNPRFDKWYKVVFNTQQGGRWGKEEKKRSMPFSKGAHFELVFMVLQEHYKVVVNGSPFYEYGHRIPVQMVTHLQVDGDLTLQSINFIGGQPVPNQGPRNAEPPNSLPAAEGPPILNPPVPYVGKLQGELAARKTILIKGYVPYHSKSFMVSLKVESTGDLALHVNPRLSEGIVVWNSHLNNSWGKEERSTSFNLFGPGQHFDLSIHCSLDHFKVSVNRQHLFDFPHRLRGFHTVDTLEVHGDVTLTYIQMLGA
ncbi:PREDICTED: galectin-4 [Condylura cristata]|uniref:galectin-4 n=1 Tax=Condylura cristata TaxID=143302 RepID=UPI0003346E16|nr:PREDICTED: galectin-4 [Condylura cristata]